MQLSLFYVNSFTASIAAIFLSHFLLSLKDVGTESTENLEAEQAFTTIFPGTNIDNAYHLTSISTFRERDHS